MWGRVLEMVKGKASMSWVARLTLVDFSGNTARLRPPPERAVARFVAQPQPLAQLQTLFEQVTGRRVHVTLDVPDDAALFVGDTPPTIDRQAVMALPLIKQLREKFDLTLMDLQPEDAASEPATTPYYPPEESEHDDV